MTAETRTGGGDSGPDLQSGGSLATPLAVVRVALGVVLIVGGWKLAFPADPAGLVDSYVDPGGGWIAPLFVEWIETILPVGVLGFLQTLGWIEMAVGLALVLGLGTPWVAALAGLMFFSFAISNPAAGMVRIAQDVAAGGFAFAVAYAGSGGRSVDAALGWFPRTLESRRDWFLGLIRVALLYALVMALLFPLGVGLNPLNETLPWIMVLALALLLLFPSTARWSCAAIAIWMAVLVGISVVDGVLDQGAAGLYWGLDAAKRQLALFGGSLAYALAGPDRLSLFPPGTSREEGGDGGEG